jgi:hypothetical protein
VAARVDRPSWATTRKTFLVAAAGGALALALGRLWSPRGGHAAPAGPARPRRAENLLETIHGPGVELRPTPVDAHGPVFRLNRSAALVWRGVDGRRSVNDLAALIALTGAGLVFGVDGSDNGVTGERA